MISNPSLWQSFFENHCQDDVNRLAGKVSQTGEPASLYVDAGKLTVFQGGALLQELISRPEAVIAHAEEGLARAYNIYNVDLEGCRVRFVNLPQHVRRNIRNIRSGQIGRFVAIEGIIRKATEVKPRIVEAVFECDNCAKKIRVQQETSILQTNVVKPHECPACKSKRVRLLSEESIKIDSQRIKIQEYPENLRGGEQPLTIDVLIEGDIAGRLNPGDRVVINGIVRDEYRKKSYAELVYIYANSFEVLQQEYEDIEITDADRERILELSREHNIHEKIARSIAPAIYGHEDIKLAIALQLFGGIPKKLPDGTELRGDIHILLVGDPGVAKSKIIKYIHRIAPRSVLVTGKGASAAGLTASAVRDELDGRWTAEAGALVLADKGICVVDELDKMRSEDRDAMHDALEDQVVAINKAGLNVTFRTRCSLLAAANPKFSRFDRYLPLAEQIDLPASLISRFDLIFTVLDEPDRERDREVSLQIITNHDSPEEVRPAIEPELLRKYIAYARQNITRVRLSEEAKRIIVDFYVELRSKAKQGPVPVTARQIEALIRLAEASAKLRLSDVVSREDAELAIRLVLKSLEQIALDPETGELDIDYVMGTPKAQRDKIAVILQIVEELENLTPKGAPEDEIIRTAEEKGIDAERARAILRKLKERGSVFCPRMGYYKVVRLG